MSKPEWSYTSLGDDKYKVSWTKGEEVICSTETRIFGSEENVLFALTQAAIRLQKDNASLFIEEPEEEGIEEELAKEESE